MNRILLLLLCLGLTACPSGDDDDSGAVTDDDDAAGLTPDTGTWDLTLDAVTEDSCNGAPNAQQGDSLGTSVVSGPAGGADFVMTDSDDQTFDCSFTTSPAFECVARPLVIQATAIPAATVTRNGTRAGTLDSSGEMTLSANRNEDTCTGAECDVVEQAGNANGPFTFPCVFAFSAEAEAQ